MAAGEAVANKSDVSAVRLGGPQKPGEGETILWEGRPRMMARKLAEMAGFFLLMGLLTWLAMEFTMPHLAGSSFAGSPDQSALPLILAMVGGMMVIIALPIWLRSSARGRARYMLTNRRALVWLGDKIVCEAILFGADVTLIENEVFFQSHNMVLNWRFKDEGVDRLRFEQIADAAMVAELAEKHGARLVHKDTGAA